MSGHPLAQVPALLGASGRLAVATIVSAKGSTPRAAGARILVLPDGSLRSTIGGGLFEARVRADAMDLLSGGGAPFLRDYAVRPDGDGAVPGVCGGTVTVFFEIVENAPQLLIVGAGHCGRALARLAAPAGFDVTVADDRGELLNRTDFPEPIRLLPLSPGLGDLPSPAPGSSVAIVSRGHVTDGVALRRFRGTAAGYLGMMGSKSKRKVLFDELAAEGWTPDELARVHCPIGLPIGAETPEEIAVSILAEVIRTRRLPVAATP